ncbi:nitrogen fixation protein NifQ [Zymomonas mobilis]|uniref:NifQ family protein n=1 Tax=Zymomonas mobilis subsp. pomaceae (strain ATCC 29192 / DSM 22645 / JCM 10191 / CCUG 17912 / NBRC 13757 / NCIMB 11200 / NRRL B-4491 / Barker I) TaxID=579138 RepID=F8EUP8_ZYMMT|nr:nitrogen fixation protein NifQ [Zymomonas mobilis]AEI38194.1 NifQ family protein [Zymomonas mobilis subsp. pomaceae ATCC 29192]MDX5947884.1 nitrogen fixation protein NifQ [Zymomonas mobilis subsp. pomaceae]GEB89952.1 iron-molybdenum cofactor biosynthesis protein NifQ [Zymomonas mobilis subsp. pomaceae]
MNIYEQLMSQAETGICDRFESHVLASIIALSMEEAEKRDCSLSETLGISGELMLSVIENYFPHALPLFEKYKADKAPECDDDERYLRDLLCRNTTNDSRTEYLLAGMIARRSMAPHHLWQDLGLRNRRELGWLMERYFEPLANRNGADMKWKKFLFRIICRDEGYGLCPSPICSECEDTDLCFGDEEGKSLLSHK